jgi:hypothetical protein
MDTAASARPARGREHLAGAIPGARMMAAAGAAAGRGGGAASELQHWQTPPSPIPLHRQAWPRGARFGYI